MAPRKRQTWLVFLVVIVAALYLLHRIFQLARR
jgi:hypothetical protein